MGIFQPPEIFENKPHFFAKPLTIPPQTLDTIDTIGTIGTIKAIDSIKVDRFDALIDFALLPRRKQR